MQEVVSAMGAVKTACMAYYTESGAGMLLSSANNPTEISRLLGIDVPVKYLDLATAGGMNVVETAANGSVITASLGTVIGGDTNNTNIILSSGVDYKNWVWTGSIPATYLPKR